METTTWGARIGALVGILFFSKSALAANHVAVITMGADDYIHETDSGTSPGAAGTGFRVDSVFISRSSDNINRPPLMASANVCVAPGARTLRYRAVDGWGGIRTTSFAVEVASLGTVLAKSDLSTTTDSGAAYLSDTGGTWNNAYMNARGALRIWGTTSGANGAVRITAPFTMPDAGLECTCPGNAEVCQLTLCSSDAQCGAGYKCNTSVQACYPYIPPCTKDADCSAGKWCTISSGKCTDAQPNGAAVPTDTGHDGSSADKSPVLNGTCSAAAGSLTCMSKVCSGTDNLCGAMNGEPATDVAQCRSGVLDGRDGKCGYDNGAPSSCTAANAALVCRSATCSANANVCIPAAGCAVDADCASDSWCSISSMTCVLKQVNGTTVPTDSAHDGAQPSTSPVLNGICTAASGALTCQSGVCDVRDNKCGYDNGAPSSCTNNNASSVCRSGFCSVSGVCQAAGACTVDNDCPANAWCAISAAICKPDLAQGASMPTDTGHDGSSADKTPVLNASCTAAAAALTCQSGVCDTSDNKCGLANGSAPSSASAAATECRAGVVGSDGKCAKLTGESCSADAQCRSNACLTNGKCDGDSDGDGVSDGVEQSLGTDPNKKDTDGDGVQDNVELSATRSGAAPFSKVDTDGDGVIDALDSDDDNDSIGTKDELGVAGAAKPQDSDGDGKPDYLDADDDNDGIATKKERDDASTARLGDDVDADGKKNWLDTDADGDGVADGDESGDANANGIADYLEANKAASLIGGSVAGGGISCSATSLQTPGAGFGAAAALVATVFMAARRSSKRRS